MVGSNVAAHDQELVATETADDVATACRGLQAVGNDLQQAVADGVTEAVVDDLEIVEVAEHHGHSLAVADGVGQQMEELLAVRQPGQRVVAGVVGQSCFETLAIGEIAIGHGEALEVALLVADADGNTRHRVSFAVLIDHLDLAAPRATVADRLADLGEHRLAVLLGDELQRVVAVQRVGSEEPLAGRVEVVGAVAEGGDGDEVGGRVGDRAESLHLAATPDFVVHVADDHDRAAVVTVVVDRRGGDDLDVAHAELGEFETAVVGRCLTVGNLGAQLFEDVAVVGDEVHAQRLNIVEDWRRVEELRDPGVHERALELATDHEDADRRGVEHSAQVVLAGACPCRVAGGRRRGHGCLFESVGHQTGEHPTDQNDGNSQETRRDAEGRGCGDTDADGVDENEWICPAQTEHQGVADPQDREPRHEVDQVMRQDEGHRDQQQRRDGRPQHAEP